MEFIFMGLIFFATVAALAFIKYLALSAGLTMSLAIPAVFLAIYGLARVQPSATAVEKPAMKE